MALSQKERDRLFLEAQFAAQKSLKSLNKAQNEVSKCKDLELRKLLADALESAIGALLVSSNKLRVITVVLGVFSKRIRKLCDHASKAYDHILDAKKYAKHSDECQEILWKDE